MKIAVLGAGAWGSALASALSATTHHVTLWGREAEVIANLNATHINTRFLPDIELNRALQYSDDLYATLDAHNAPDDVLIIATPIAGLRETAHKIAAHSTQAAVLWLCKGVERDSLQFPHQVVGNILRPQTPFGVLSGPSFAQEVARGLPCALVLASEFTQLDLAFVQKLSSQNLRIYHSTDVIGVELGGAHKNVLAIAAGISDGLQLGMNARAALLTRGIAEMRRFASALGANADTISGLAGVGDLILTATGNLSRNRTVGLQLAQGRTLDEISADLGHVAEGALCANAMLQIANALHIKAPITQGVCAILDGVPPRTVLEQLLLREAVRE
ncbi:MAG: hypothetical protein H6R05_152 [Burkholderiaceae bacterium]|nr:hypothetical protein [Burkholderiaceae bacterium]